jgi:predicted small secreted protein
MSDLSEGQIPVTIQSRNESDVSMMKKFLVSAVLLVAATLPAYSQVGQDLKSAGKDVKDATVTGADKTASGTKKAYSATKNGVKKGVNKTATATRKGADKVANKTSTTTTSSPK